LITRRTCNTFNGWKITKRESKWIDDVLTSPPVKPYAAAIMLTDSTVFPLNASDHNGVLRKSSSHQGLCYSPDGGHIPREGVPDKGSDRVASAERAD
jgi:hypothetical protein